MSTDSLSSSSGSKSNYIIRIQTGTDDYPVYHGKMLLFGVKQLTTILVPEFFYTLKLRCSPSEILQGLKTSYPGVFEDVKLPSISTKYPEQFEGLEFHTTKRIPLLMCLTKPLEFFDDVRAAIANAILFLHVWGQENSSSEFSKLVDDHYSTYGDFFKIILDYITKTETDIAIRELASNLRNKLDHLESYMGPYQHNFKEAIYPTTEVMAGILSMFCAYTAMSTVFR